MNTDPTPELRDYQRIDLAEILKRFLRGDTAVACGWSPGLGKSLLSILVAKRMGHRRMLVTCPSIAIVSWGEQLDQWWPSAKRLMVRAGKDIAKLTPDHNVVIVTYDLARNDDVRTRLRDWAEGGFAVVDEAQYLRGPSTKRTASTYGRGEGLLAKAQNVLLLSGTYIVSWPDDLWTHLARWMPERILMDGKRMDYEQFRDYFLMTREVPISGTYAKRIAIYGMTPEKREELKGRLQDWALFRTKEEAGLPPLTWRTMPLELTAADRKAIDDELYDNLPERLHGLMKAANANSGDIDAAQRFADALAGYTDMMAVAMRVLGVGKAKAMVRILKEKLDNSPDAIGIFAVNHKVMDVFDAELRPYGVVRVDGSTSSRNRELAVQNFMDTDGPRVFNGQISACGTALTLVRADTCYFPQLSWTPGENVQAASRFHRIGQLNPVTAHIPTVPGTLDMPLMAVLRKKTEAASAMMQT
jgi:SNF2 family DNA or RNA helicase